MNTFIATQAITQLEDWIIYLQDVKEPGEDEADEMIAFLQAQLESIILALPPVGEA
jgi:hypothetical protein